MNRGLTPPARQATLSLPGPQSCQTALESLASPGCLILAADNSLPLATLDFEINLGVDVVLLDDALDHLSDCPVNPFAQADGVDQVVFLRRAPAVLGCLDPAECSRPRGDPRRHVLLGPVARVYVPVPTNEQIVAVAVNVDEPLPATQPADQLSPFLDAVDAPLPDDFVRKLDTFPLRLSELLGQRFADFLLVATYVRDQGLPGVQSQ